RPADFAHSQAHFEEWENVAREFILSPRGRRVWKMGGILWRVALYLSGDTRTGFELMDSNPGAVTRQVTGTAFDEVLTESEINLIMGTYHVASPSVSQIKTLDLSYWPHPKLLYDSNFNFGCWTPVNESWFVERLKALRIGSAGPTNQKKWRSQFRVVKAMRERRDRSRAAAVEFLL
ncbi:hypothetical protein SCHPADRAFT_812901, partial [Schizopora paradoxa]